MTTKPNILYRATNPENRHSLERIATEAGSGPVPKTIAIPALELRDPTLTPGVATWPAANRAIYTPFTVGASLTVVSIGTVIGNVGGTIDFGVYDELGVSLYLHGGATATANTFYKVTTNFSLGRGIYYLGIASSGTAIELFRHSASLFGGSGGVPAIDAVGIKQQASAYPLPASATFATVASGYMPIAVIEVRVRN